MAVIGVVGAGAWGTAFAVQLAKNGHAVRLWAFEPDLVQTMRQTRENDLYLPGIEIPETVTPTAEMAKACDVQIVVLACPSNHFRAVASKAVEHTPHDAPLVILTKGLEEQTLELMTEVLVGMLDPQRAARIAVLSGPSFAREVAEGQPTDVVLAALDNAVAKQLQQQFHTSFFRVYTSDDPIGVQVGATIKNVIAIAAGGIDGMGLGLNTRAALITRGLAEVTRLGVAKGANPLTFLGLAGIGDLVLTCTGELSRNRTFGKRVARGEGPLEIIESQGAVVEGYYAAKAGYRLSQQLGVDMPITEQVYKVLHEDKPLQDALRDLLKREFKDELMGIVRVDSS